MPARQHKDPKFQRPCRANQVALRDKRLTRHTAPGIAAKSTDQNRRCQDLGEKSPANVRKSRARHNQGLQRKRQGSSDQVCPRKEPATSQNSRRSPRFSPKMARIGEERDGLHEHLVCLGLLGIKRGFVLSGEARPPRRGAIPKSDEAPVPGQVVSESCRNASIAGLIGDRSPSPSASDR